MTRRHIPNIGTFTVAAIEGVLALAVLCMALLFAARPAQAQTETVLYNFYAGTNIDDGAYPYASLTSDGAGNFYGTNWSGGSCTAPLCMPPGPAGTVFELSPNGYGGFNETVLYSFCSAPNCADGAAPESNLVFDSVGNLYGTTLYGGSGGPGGDNGCAAFGDGCGVVFELSPVGTGWKETVLYSFCLQSGCPDGANPSSGLIFDRAGNLYGTAGTVFELSPSSGGWTEKVIYTTGGPGGLTMDAAGNIFGVTPSTAFELSPNRNGGWTPTVIYTFTSPTDGGVVEEAPVLDSAGNLYGTTTYGGTYNYGTVYKLSPGNNGKWTEQILHSFNINGSDGGYPLAGIVLDAAGNIYGTTAYGGAYYVGAVYELVAQGGSSYEEKILCSFNISDGAYPFDSLILDSAGNLYGTTEEGGSTIGQGPDGFGFGVAFKVSTSTKSGTYTKVASSLNPSTYGQKITWAAAVKTIGSITPTGTVNFSWEGYSIGTATLNDSGVATLTKSNLNVYTYPLTATYSGDANNASSRSAILNQVVKEATSAAKLTSSPNPSTKGQSVIFTATITSPTIVPTGPVTFTSGTTVLGTAQLNGGKATFTTSELAVGSTAVKATYSGDSNIAESSASVTQTVQP
jgi:uncharacterized repeat protein (TIGR03803 family)